jgi:hypothetical protein
LFLCDRLRIPLLPRHAAQADVRLP